MGIHKHTTKVNGVDKTLEITDMPKGACFGYYFNYKFVTAKNSRSGRYGIKLYLPGDDKLHKNVRYEKGDIFAVAAEAIEADYNERIKP